ncbi:MAG: glutathione peroxidase [Burkholderiaceae bacterium]|nr:glutathione peroxidase [Burkholderiaceae bacterium]
MLPDISLKRIDGAAENLRDYAGKVLLVVNVASRCGFTPQYAELQALYDEVKDAGFEILAFPCNQFGAQEPGSPQEIAQFCSTRYAVTFPVFEKTDVNGPSAHPLYQHLKTAAPGLFGTESIKWNFTKFLIDRSGKALERYAPQQGAKDIRKDLMPLLAE